MSAFISPLMLSAVNVAIPAIANELNTTAIMMSWIPSAYLLSSAVFLLPFGRIADSFGRKRIYQSGLIIITIASVMAAATDSISWLLLCRVLQGLGAAMLFSTGTAILSSVFPPKQRGAAIGLSISAVYLGLTAGPIIGGWATTAFGWRAAFVIHIPLALLVIIVTAIKLKTDWKDDHPKKFDLAGSVIYGWAIFTTMYGLSLLPQLSGISFIVLGSLGLVLFFRYASQKQDPIFDVSLFRTNRLFTFSCLASLAVYSSTFATSYLMSLYLQYIKGLTPQVAGIVMIGQPLIMTFLSPVAGKLSDKYEPRVLASFGVALISTGLALLAGLSATSTLITVFFYLALTGLGFALFSSPNVNAIMSSVEKRDLGIAAGSTSTMRVLGQMTSMAVVTSVFAILLGPVELSSSNHNLLMQSISSSFIVASILAATAILLSMKRGNMRIKES